jgi:hypothetical protein
MRLLTLVLTITTVFAITSTAKAETIRLKNRYSQAQIKATCDKVGGQFNAGSKSYGCLTNVLLRSVALSHVPIALTNV